MTQTPSDVARAAADIIETRGLHKGDFADRSFYLDNNPNCSVCTLGAVNEAITGSPAGGYKTDVQSDLFYATRDGLIRFLGDELPHKSISMWSDSEDRTAEDVYTALRKFADNHDTQIDAAA